MTMTIQRHSNGSHSHSQLDSFAAFLSEWAEAEDSPAQMSSHQPQYHRPFSLHPLSDIPIPSGALRRRNNRFSYDDDGHDISNDGSSRLSHEEELNLSRLSENGHGNISNGDGESVVTGSGYSNGGIPSMPFDGRSNEQATQTQTQQSPSTSRRGLASGDHHQASAVPSDRFAPFLSSKRAKRIRRRSTL